MSSERGNSHTNPEIGRSLEQARAERGLSLWQVEEATKIRARYLHDLERENFDVLPAVYVLGSLKTYADFLGLDGEALARELKSRQEPPPEERDPTPEEPAQSERGGFLATLGGLPLIGDRDVVGDDQGAAPAAALGYGSRLYLVVLGAVSILVLAIALTTILWRGDQPAVSQVSEPAIPEAPSRIAFSGDERNQDTESKDDRTGEQAESPDGGNEKGKKEDEKDQVEKNDQDDTRPDDTGDVAVGLPASITAASTASASAAAASASAAAPATSTPAATASASAPSAATVPAASAAPQTPKPGARAPAGPRRAEAAGTRPVKRIVEKVRIVRSFSR